MAAKKTSAKRAQGSANDMQGQLLNMLHQVWLAGLGAVSRAQQGAPKLLEELIAEGARVQADTQQSAAKALRGALSRRCRRPSTRAWVRCVAKRPTPSKIWKRFFGPAYTAP